jgi:hypothetical protein
MLVLPEIRANLQRVTGSRMRARQDLSAHAALG